MPASIKPALKGLEKPALRKEQAVKKEKLPVRLRTPQMLVQY